MSRMPSRSTRRRGRRLTPRFVLLGVVVFLLVARDAPARMLVLGRLATEAAMTPSAREPRGSSWSAALGPIEVTDANTRAHARIDLYDRQGDIDDDARVAFERIAAREPEPHRLAARVEQLVFKAAYHFGEARVVIVSAWREHAGKHTAGEAIDFKLVGVPARRLAAYLRGLPRVGVGVYTNPATQFVHVDVREASYHWVDASPPRVHWKERPMGDRSARKRDAAYTPETDLPVERP
jgi:Bacterial protein of unknown function (DUF882)